MSVRLPPVVPYQHHRAVYGRRIGIVEECVEYLLSYGGVYGVEAPLRTPYVEGGVFDVPDRAVGVGGGHLGCPPWWMIVPRVAPNVERIHEPARPLLNIESPLVSGGEHVYNSVVPQMAGRVVGYGP